jgi:hypothetical protein
VQLKSIAKRLTIHRRPKRVADRNADDVQPLARQAQSLARHSALLDPDHHRIRLWREPEAMRMPIRHHDDERRGQPSLPLPRAADIRRQKMGRHHHRRLLRAQPPHEPPRHQQIPRAPQRLDQPIPEGMIHDAVTGLPQPCEMPHQHEVGPPIPVMEPCRGVFEDVRTHDVRLGIAGLRGVGEGFRSAPMACAGRHVQDQKANREALADYAGGFSRRNIL